MCCDWLDLGPEAELPGPAEKSRRNPPGSPVMVVEQAEMKALPPYLVREMVTVHDEVCAQSMGAVLCGCGLLLGAQEEGHGLLQQRRGAQLSQQGC